jgi:hypothetical protein
MPWVGFEPTTPVFQRARTFHAPDRTATVIGLIAYTLHNLIPTSTKHVMYFCLQIMSSSPLEEETPIKLYLEEVNKEERALCV